jgi:inner membrane protease subunit 2
MRPTLNPCGSNFSDFLAVRRIRKKEEIESINVSSILCITHPKQERAYLVKRLVANQNEKISIQNFHKIETKDSVKIIPKGHCWVESDAGPGFLDSTSYLGPIPYKMIVGKALYVIWPPHRIKKL